jgi:hypothetical protein
MEEQGAGGGTFAGRGALRVDHHPKKNLAADVAGNIGFIVKTPINPHQDLNKLRALGAS